ncbi:MAG: hypothetical protein BWX84_01044 [Verrucomicrobia bacterium ADurb.Bin118]|nr:MAG: hypothetical protein BWX84_01044 [Verrucomicrobia bacterium ADurb.Bin118]
MAWLHDGHAGGQRLQHIQAKGFTISRGHGQHRQAAQKRNFFGSIRIRRKHRFANVTRLREPLAQLTHPRFIAGFASAADVQFKPEHVAPPFQFDERLHERVQALVPGHPREKSQHRRRSFWEEGGLGANFKAGRINPAIHDTHPFGG